MNNKVIKVLDTEHGRKVIEFFKQYCNTSKLEGSVIGCYYGVINGKFDIWDANKILEANAEVIELPEEKTYRLGKNTKGNNFTCVSGTIELPEEKAYPRVMLVSEDGKNWYKRVVFMKKCGVYLAWANAETLEESKEEKYTSLWKYAREIEHIEVTLEDIAKWQGVSKEQIIIKN